MERYAEAVVSLQQSLELNPDLAIARDNLKRVQQALLNQTW